MSIFLTVCRLRVNGKYLKIGSWPLIRFLQIVIDIAAFSANIDTINAKKYPGIDKFIVDIFAAKSYTQIDTFREQSCTRNKL